MRPHPGGCAQPPRCCPARLQASDINREARELLRIRDYMDNILAQATGQPFALQPIPAEAFVGVLTGFGIPRVFAYSFLETYQQMDGVVPAGYEGYGEALFHWAQESSPELLALGWKAKTVEEWCNSPAIKAAFSK